MNLDFMRELVRGFVWKARMANGAVFEVWTYTSDSTRSEMRKQILSEANKGGDPEDPSYLSTDIEQLWRTKG